MKAKVGLLLVIIMSFSAAMAAGVSPMAVEGATTIDTSKAKQLFDQEVLFVDVRKDSDWEAGRIPGAVHIELKKVFTEAALSDEAAKDEAIVLYCNGEKCMRSSKATAQAVGWGFSKVYYYRDGFPAWQAAQMPVE
ncbi:MAG: rhodanese-like domain-containing protein [bacterium]